MNAISYAIQRGTWDIPPQILKAVFAKRHFRWGETPQSIDKAIMDLVVRPRVLVDCSLIGSLEVTIPLMDVPKEYVEPMVVVYRIPKDLVQNQTIISVANITFADPTLASQMATMANYRNSTVLQAGAAVMDAHGNMPMVSSARVEIVGENAVMIKDSMLLPNNIFLRCTLSNDETMSHLSPRSFPAFSQLVAYAIKAYIWTQMVVEMDQGVLSGGGELGAYRDVISEYKECLELYNTYQKEQWTAISEMNDTETYYRHLRWRLGGYR